jgi:hypothetical protein
MPHAMSISKHCIGPITYHLTSTVTTFTGLHMWALFSKCTKSITCHTCRNRKQDIPQNQNDITITWPVLTRSPYSTYLSILLLIFFQVQDCSKIVNKYVQMQNLPLMKQFLWDAGNWGKSTITSHHHTISHPYHRTTYKKSASLTETVKWDLKLSWW